MKNEENESIWGKLANIDPPWIYLIQVLAITIPLLLPIGLPLGTISSETLGVYNYVNDLPEGSIILQAVNMGPAAAAECEPSLHAILHHNREKGHQVIFYTIQAEGTPYIEAAGKAIFGTALSDHPDYGTKIVNIGYIPGLESGFAGFAADIFFTNTDAYGNDLETTFFKDLPTRSAKDFDLGITYGSGNFAWIVQYLRDPYGVEVAGGIAAGLAAEAYPFYPESTAGFLVGLRGGAEYELLIKKPGYAAAGMDAQSLAHLTILIMIIVGNIGYWYQRRSDESKLSSGGK